MPNIPNTGYNLSTIPPSPMRESANAATSTAPFAAFFALRFFIFSHADKMGYTEEASEVKIASAQAA